MDLVVADVDRFCEAVQELFRDLDDETYDGTTSDIGSDQTELDFAMLTLGHEEELLAATEGDLRAAVETLGRLSRAVMVNEEADIEPDEFLLAFGRVQTAIERECDELYWE